MNGPPLRDASVLFSEEGILELSCHSVEGAEDLGEVAIVPGFINAHVHLELSDCSLPLPFPVQGTFADWLRQVIAVRQSRPHPRELAAGDNNPRDRGIREAASAGTGACCDISQSTAPWRGGKAANFPIIDCHEGLGLGSNRISSVIRDWERHLEGGWGCHDKLVASGPPYGGNTAGGRGLSPHAPYSTSIQLVDAAVDLSRQHRALVAMHLAESDEEIQFLANGRGPLREFLEDLKVWPCQPEEHFEKQISGYLARLSQATRALVIHGNHLSPSDCMFLAEHRSYMALVHCPRTHAYFRRPPFDLQRMIELGVEVAIGTDSRASNPDLSMHEELKALVREYPGISPERLWDLVTAAGARALGLSAGYGQLIVGGPASCVAIQLDPTHGTTPWEQAAGPGSKVVGVW